MVHVRDQSGMGQCGDREEPRFIRHIGGRPFMLADGLDMARRRLESGMI